MGLVAKVTNAALLAVVAAVGLTAGQTEVRPLVGEAFASEVSALEQAAAREPSADAVRALATAYLDRNEPGLAAATLERAPAHERGAPTLAYVEARALYARGRSGEALAVLEGLERRCGGGTDCPGWLVAKVERQADFLRALGAAGIEDPAVQPDAAREVLERSRRQSRVVAIAMR